jgi:hypothetical protein
MFDEIAYLAGNYQSTWPVRDAFYDVFLTLRMFTNSQPSSNNNCMDMAHLLRKLDHAQRW